jgi:transcription initiation factor TFIID subunit TAF12
MSWTTASKSGDHQLVEPGPAVDEAAACAVSDAVEVHQFQADIRQLRVQQVRFQKQRIEQHRTGRRGHAEVGVQVEIRASGGLQQVRCRRNGGARAVLRAPSPKNTRWPTSPVMPHSAVGVLAAPPRYVS